VNQQAPMADSDPARPADRSLVRAQSIASAVALGATLSMVGALKLGASAIIQWTSIALSLLSSFAAIAIYAVRRFLSRTVAPNQLLDLPAQPRPLPESRITVAMVLILVMSTALVALRLHVWLAVLPVLALGIIAWVWLIIVAWRTRNQD
jgi:hypothetical protein